MLTIINKYVETNRLEKNTNTYIKAKKKSKKKSGRHHPARENNEGMDKEMMSSLELRT